MAEPEPWLRGALTGVPAHLQPVFFSFQQVREDLADYATGLSAEQLWREMAGKNSIGFHLKHIAGSVDRLTTYLMGQPLSEKQFEFLRDEHLGDRDLAELSNLVDASLQAAQQRLMQVGLESLTEPRAVGRNQLPTTVLGLLIHLCEHTQRHLGQTILLSKLLKQE